MTNVEHQTNDAFYCLADIYCPLDRLSVLSAEDKGWKVLSDGFLLILLM